MSDKRAAARKSADELAAGAVNGQDNEERFDADAEERIKAEVDEPEIGKATDLAGILAEMRYDFSGNDNDSRYVREYCDRLEAATKAGGVEVKVEVGVPAELSATLAELRAEMDADPDIPPWLTPYIESIEALCQSATDAAALNVENHVREAGGLVKAVKAVKADAEARGIVWDETNTEPALKTFHVEIKFDIDDRLKLGILAARCRETPERFLESQLRIRFDEVADKVFLGGGKKRSDMDKASEETYHALSAACDAGAVGKGLLTFKPAIMA